MYILCRHLRGEYILSDTIAAVSTAMTSSSGIGIVRMSGPDAVRIADLVFRGKRPGKLSDMPSHTIHYGYIFDGDDIIDEVLLMLMKAPNTYTREDVVEISCHGGITVLKRILDNRLSIVFQHGITIAVSVRYHPTDIVWNELSTCDLS